MIADSLHGPTSGIVTLPHHLDWSGSSSYDLDEPAILATMYKTVLLEAATLEDLRTWLDRDRLTRIWPELWLPRALRRGWQERFPELGRAQGP